eukprot:Seg877.4 transcript_id=Seg877.4/GoldUCD/mRNA.D3Y31 product="hypothetical protein" protein_id=Seg877.4/GoldUCD/D3Y31
MFFLTVADGLYAVTALPLGLTLFTKYKSIRFCALEYATIFAAQFVANMSCYFTLLIAFHRYLKISPNLKNRTYGPLKRSLMSGKLANCLAALCVISPFLHGVCSTHIFGFSKSSWPNLVMKGIDLIVFLSVYILYFRVYYNVTRKRPTVNTAATQVNGQRKPRRSYEKEFTKTVLLILISLAINVIPLTITDLWTSTYIYIIRKRPPQIAIFLYYLSWAQISAVCFIDAVIFIYRNRKIKDCLKAWRQGCNGCSLRAREDRTENGGNGEGNGQTGITVANRIYDNAKDDTRT